jgi:apolipoprotein N-acyltransferase
MATLTFIHGRLSVTMLLFMLALGLWGLWNFLRGEGMTGSYWGGLAIGEGLVIVQGLLGVALYVLGGAPSRGILHILYGVVSMISLPAAFSFTRGRSTRYETLIYAIIALFLAGVSIRARLTGGG